MSEDENEGAEFVIPLSGAIGVADGEILIWDPAAFAKRFNCKEGFVMVKNGDVFVLDDATGKMRNIEEKPKTGSAVRSVK